MTTKHIHPPRGRKILTVFSRAALCAVLLAAFPLKAGAQSPAGSEPKLSTLSELVKEWMNIRTAISSEKREWDEKRKQWETEIGLLNEETRQLETEINQNKDSESTAQTELSRASEEKERMGKVLESLDPVLRRTETQLKNLEKFIPAGISADAQRLFRQLPETDAQAKEQTVSERAQTVVAVLATLETLNNTVHLMSRLLETGDGKRRQVDILYLGLGRGFAVSPDNNWAGTGSVTEDGWKWTARPELAGKIREAVRVYRREETAKLCALPMKTTGIEEGAQ